MAIHYFGQLRSEENMNYCQGKSEKHTVIESYSHYGQFKSEKYMSNEESWSG